LRDLTETFAELNVIESELLTSLTNRVRSSGKVVMPTTGIPSIHLLLRELKAMLARSRMTIDEDCPDGWVHITECQALSTKMLEIVKLQSSTKPMENDGDRLMYLWQFARVESEAAKEAVDALHQRSQALVKEEKANMHNRHVSGIRLDRYVV
jgi:hypothetical protein